MWILDLYLLGAIVAGTIVLLDAENFRETACSKASAFHHSPFTGAVMFMAAWPLVVAAVITIVLSEGRSNTRR